MNLATFPEDPALPQVKMASDAVLMREIFRGHLRPCSRKTYQIQDCILTRVRYRQAASCLLQYKLRLVDSATGRERIQWVAGLIYPRGSAEQILQELRSADPKQEITGALQTFEPVSFIPKLGMLVQVFPYDRQLLSLPLLLAGPLPEVKSLLLAQFGPGSWHPEAWKIEPIQYRAEKAAVLKYTVQARDGTTGKREERRFYLKIYRKEKGQQIYQLLQALWERKNTRGEYFTVGRPIAYLRDLHALIQEEASGISFQQILLRGQDHEADSAARQVARALAALHLDHISTTRHHLLHHEVTRLNRAGKLLQWACPQLKKEPEAIVGTIVAGLKEVPLRPAHLDLKADHILLDGDRYTLLDLDSFALADPVLDAAHILAQIVGMQFCFSLPQGRLRMAARIFSEEYFNQVPGTWRSRLRARYAGALLKVAVGFFKRQEPQWPEKVAAMVAEAKDSLARKVW